jgi:nitrogen fixation NifU-like protein
MDLYRAQILDHNKNPHNFGHLDHPDHSVTLFNSACGDKIIMDVKFGKDGRTVRDIAFSGEGCAVSQASASLLTDYVRGMTKKKVLKLKMQTIMDLLHTTLTPSRMKCALLPLEALQKCILEWEKPTVV